ncbi:protein kinase domain-containing protein [Streptomyces sp. MMS24-I2-30]|uniref:serine/threonine-protein kinase n=1 Tax=Streptomyces sp. MMS24-I2-30 TaxID=3351564 RepID=UPI003896C779
MGEVFAGRYELADPIGHGGVGAVWRAWDHRRRRYVAAKVLQQRDAHSLLRFVREQALRIDHPHVLAPASWAADDDKVLFTMDLVAGGSLVHLVGDYGPLPPAVVCTLLDQLLSGLAAVHEEGVVHRDIKPANILLEATGTGRPRLRLSDFGIAMRLGEPRLTETNLVVGTPGYLAPEQMLGAEPDFPADLFAAGLVALYLLEGAKPDAKALVQYFAERGTPGAPKGVPEPLWQVVSTLLQPDPVARFRTATGARKALVSAMELLPEPGPDDELIEIFDQLGPLPPGFGPEGPLKPASGVDVEAEGNAGTRPGQPGPAAPGGASGAWTAGEGVWTAGAGVSGAAVSGASFSSSAVSGVGRGHGPFGAQDMSASVHDHPTQDPYRVSGRTRPAGTGSVPGSPEAPASVDPREATGPQSAGMSDTGSFHLPPPQPARPHGTQSPPTPAAQPYVPLPQQADQHVDHHIDHQADHQTAQPQPQHPAQAQPPTVTVPNPGHSSASPSPYVSPHALSSPHPQTSWNPAQALPPEQPRRVDAPTVSYTAQSPRVPDSAPESPAPAPHRATRHARRARRPGPPAKAAIPILLLALACYAVGFWALTRV